MCEVLEFHTLFFRLNEFIIRVHNVHFFLDQFQYDCQRQSWGVAKGAEARNTFLNVQNVL